MVKFKPTMKGAMEYYDSIELYEDRLKLKDEFKKETGKKGEWELYKYIRDYKLKKSKKMIFHYEERIITEDEIEGHLQLTEALTSVK